MIQVTRSAEDDFLEDAFPKEDTFTDCTGMQRVFALELSTRSGYVVTAREKDRESGGYRFEARSETAPYLALGLLRQKIRKALAVRYLTVEDGRRYLSHDEMQGRIDYGAVVVDGETISFQEFVEMLQVYEGFSFSLTITDPID